jgi:hypothetical protein
VKTAYEGELSEIAEGTDKQEVVEENNREEQAS